MREHSGPSVGEAVSRIARDLAHGGIEQPVLEAQLLVALARETDRLRVLTQPSEVLSTAQASRLDELLARRASREPLAYIRCSQDFYGLEFKVTPAVLIPRPETELLVDRVIQELGNHPEPLVIDVGTGSGCIAVSAAVHLPRLRVLAIDRSPDALEVARENAQAHGVSGRIEFVMVDMRCAALPAGVEMIVSNPPYIPSGEMGLLQPEVRDFEPSAALDGGADGLTFHRALIELGQTYLPPGGALAMEVALGQSSQIMAMLSHAGFVEVAADCDLQGIERAVSARKAA